MKTPNQTPDYRLQWYRLILAKADYVSETTERARAYLIEQGYDPDELVRNGLEKLKKLKERIDTERNSS